MERALTVGKFESLHAGHIQLIQTLNKASKERGLSSVIMRFEPHPAVFFSGKPQPSLFTQEEKIRILQNNQPDEWRTQPFDAAFAAMPPQDFIAWLKNTLNCRLFVAGEGFAFGKGRTGTIKTIHDEGIETLVVPHRTDGTEKISTSRIRALILDGQMPQAAALLGRPFFLSGIVEEGRKIGRTLGFPTLNIYPPENKLLPPSGVYASRVLYNYTSYNAVTNIGCNPTVSESGGKRAETHIFDANTDMYGVETVVELHTFLRPEIKFTDISHLKAQISTDIEKAKQFWGGKNT
jgi:riboflavin kinase/FMN adenylyltransferase